MRVFLALAIEGLLSTAVCFLFLSIYQSDDCWRMSLAELSVSWCVSLRGSKAIGLRAH